MKLSKSEAKLFYDTWFLVHWKINEKHQITEPFEPLEFGIGLDMTPMMEIRKVLWENPQWIEEVIEEDETVGDFTDEQKALLSSWADFHVKGTFLVAEHRQNHSTFLNMDDEGCLYGVMGIVDPIKKMIPVALPAIVETTLLPFKGKIVFDTSFSTARKIEKDMVYRLQNLYQTAKQAMGTTLKLDAETFAKRDQLRLKMAMALEGQIFDDEEPMSEEEQEANIQKNLELIREMAQELERKNPELVAKFRETFQSIGSNENEG